MDNEQLKNQKKLQIVMGVMKGAMISDNSGFYFSASCERSLRK